MEHDIVLPDEVYQTGFGIFPPRLPRIGQQLLRIADIADGRIEPHIKHLALGTFHRHGNAPVQVTAHGTGLQTHVEPTLALPVHVVTPFLVVFQNPLAQPCLVLVQRQIPMLRLAHHRFRAADGTLGVNQVGGRQRRAALLALVAVCPLCMTMGAFARNVTVGQESMCLLVVILHRGFLHELALVVQGTEKLRSRLAMHFGRRAPVHIERNAEFLERVLDDFMITVYHVLRRDTLLLGPDGDGHAMLVGTADEKHVFLLQTKVTHVNVRRNIHPCQMTDVHRTVGVWQSRRDGRSLEILFHFLYFKQLYPTLSGIR